jgi:hypothetical protein
MSPRFREDDVVVGEPCFDLTAFVQTPADGESEGLILRQHKPVSGLHATGIVFRIQGMPPKRK